MPAPCTTRVGGVAEVPGALTLIERGERPSQQLTVPEVAAMLRTSRATVSLQLVAAESIS